MGSESTFHGYGPDLGYDFLRAPIAEIDYRARGADISPEEIVISDGSKCDTANIQELFAHDLHIAIPDPVYPVYVDTNVMAGRTGAVPGRAIRRADLSGLHGGQRVCSRSAEVTGGPRVPLLPQQPHGGNDHPRAARGLGGIRAEEQGADPVRCGVRVVHPR